MYCERCGRVLNRATGRCVCEGEATSVDGLARTAAEHANSDSYATAVVKPSPDRRLPPPPPEPKWSLETDEEWRTRTGMTVEAQPEVAAWPSQPPAPAPRQWPPAAQPVRNSNATTAFVLSILSFVICPVVLAVAALVVAAKAKRQIRESSGPVEGESLATASQVVSVANIVVSAISMVLVTAIAVPTFMAARERVYDRAAQSALRSALSAEMVHFTEAQRWTTQPAELAAIEPDLRYEPGDTPVRFETVYLFSEGPLIGLATKSKSQTCFYVVADARELFPVSAADETRSFGYAQDPRCGPLQAQDYAADRPA